MVFSLSPPPPPPSSRAHLGQTSAADVAYGQTDRGAQALLAAPQLEVLNNLDRVGAHPLPIAWESGDFFLRGEGGREGGRERERERARAREMSLCIMALSMHTLYFLLHAPTFYFFYFSSNPFSLSLQTVIRVHLDELERAAQMAPLSCFVVQIHCGILVAPATYSKRREKKESGEKRTHL